MAAILNSAMLDSAILVFPLKPTYTCQDSVPNICTKNFTHSFWLNLMMAAILNSANHGFSHLHKKNFTHSFWLNLMMAAILNSAMFNLAILDSAILVFPLKLTSLAKIGSHHLHKKTLIHLWLNMMMAAILKFCHLDSAILHKKTSLIHSDSTWWWQPSWILPSGLRYCHLGFRHLVIFSQIYSKTLSLHSDSDSN